MLTSRSSTNLLSLAKDDDFVSEEQPQTFSKPHLSSRCHVEGEWNDQTAGGNMSSPSWRHNPQYHLYFEGHRRLPVYARITLQQINEEVRSLGIDPELKHQPASQSQTHIETPRIFDGGDPPDGIPRTITASGPGELTRAISTSSNEEDDVEDELRFKKIGLYLCKYRDDHPNLTGKRLIVLHGDNFVSVSSCAHKRKIDCEVTLPYRKYGYVVIAMTSVAGQTGKFVLSIESTQRATLTLIPDDDFPGACWYIPPSPTSPNPPSKPVDRPIGTPQHDPSTKLAKWFYQEIYGKWEGEFAGGCRHYPSWRNNPQYRLVLTEPTTLVISLSQVPRLSGSSSTLKNSVTPTSLPLRLRRLSRDSPGSSPHLKAGTGPVPFRRLSLSPQASPLLGSPEFSIPQLRLDTDASYDKLATIGFYLAQTTNSVLKKTTLQNDRLLIKTLFKQELEICEEKDIDPAKVGSNLILIPATYKPGDERKYKICIWSSVPLQSITLLTATWVSTQLEGQWTASTAGGGWLNWPSFRDNPRYKLTLTPPKDKETKSKSSGEWTEKEGYSNPETDKSTSPTMKYHHTVCVALSQGGSGPNDPRGLRPIGFYVFRIKGSPETKKKPKTRRGSLTGVSFRGKFDEDDLAPLSPGEEDECCTQKLENDVVFQSPIDTTREASAKLVLTSPVDAPGVYHIVPVCQQPGMVGAFVLTIYSEGSSRGGSGTTVSLERLSLAEAQKFGGGRMLRNRSTPNMKSLKNLATKGKKPRILSQILPPRVKVGSASPSPAPTPKKKRVHWDPDTSYTVTTMESSTTSMSFTENKNRFSSNQISYSKSHGNFGSLVGKRNNPHLRELKMKLEEAASGTGDSPSQRTRRLDFPTSQSDTQPTAPPMTQVIGLVVAAGSIMGGLYWWYKWSQNPEDKEKQKTFLEWLTRR